MFHEETSQSPKPTTESPFDRLPAKTSFVFGFITSILALCTIGFIALLKVIFF